MSSTHHTAAWIASIAGTVIGLAMIALGIYFFQKRVPGETTDKIKTAKVTGSVIGGVGLFILVVGWIWLLVSLHHRG